jgi:zinc protease
LQAFYKKNYQPDNAVLVVAGKIDEEKTLAMVNEYFGVIPRPERTLPTYYTRDPVQDGERMVTVKRVGDVQWAGVGYKVSAGSHPDYAAISIISEVIGATPSGRMYKALIDTKKASTTFTWDFQLKEPGMIASFAQVLKDKSLDEVRKSMIKVYDDLTTTPPTQEEVERAKTKILKDNELFFNSSEDIGLALSEYIGMGDWRLLFLHRDRVMNTTVDDVARVAKHYFKPDNRTVGLFIPTENPDRAEIPADPDVEALVKDYKGRAAIAMGEEFDPTPANIDARTVKSALGNGMKVAYLPKKTRGESVQLNMTLRFGDEASLKNKGKAGSYAASLLDKGTTKMTRQQIQDAFNRLKAEVRFYGSASAVSVSIETTRPNLAEVLRLVNQILREPSFPADEFEKLKSQQIAGIESQRREPTSVAVMRIQKYLSPYTKEDTRYVEDFDESIVSINALKLDDIRKFHKDFYGTNNGTLAIAGDFDLNEVQPLVNELFGNWKSPANYKRLENRMKKVTPINESIETPDKPNAFFIALQQIEMRDNHPDYAALSLGHYMLGGGFLNSRLATRIRQKEGISYGVGSSFSAAPIDNIGTFQAYAIYAPENVERLEVAFQEELAKVISEGFTEEEVTAAKSGWLQSRTVNRAQDQYLASTLNGYLFLGRAFDWDDSFEKKIQNLTVAEINEAMKKYLDPKAISIVKAGDFAKAKGN